jgi:hypothetical protein
MSDNESTRYQLSCTVTTANGFSLLVRFCFVSAEQPACLPPDFSVLFDGLHYFSPFFSFSTSFKAACFFFDSSSTFLRSRYSISFCFFTSRSALRLALYSYFSLFDSAFALACYSLLIRAYSFRLASYYLFLSRSIFSYSRFFSRAYFYSCLAFSRYCLSLSLSFLAYSISYLVLRRLFFSYLF